MRVTENNGGVLLKTVMSKTNRVTIQGRKEEEVGTLLLKEVMIKTMLLSIIYKLFI